MANMCCITDCYYFSAISVSHTHAEEGMDLHFSPFLVWTGSFTVIPWAQHSEEKSLWMRFTHTNFPLVICIQHTQRQLCGWNPSSAPSGLCVQHMNKPIIWGSGSDGVQIS